MSKFLDGIIGFSVGDAMGMATEFQQRETLFKNPVKEMLDSSIM